MYSQNVEAGALSVVGMFASPRRVMEAIVFSSILVLSGCATTASLGYPSLTNEELLRTDMVDSLLSIAPQLLEPMSTTIQFNENESGDAPVVISRLVEMGYGLQRVDADQGKHFLRIEEVPVKIQNDKKGIRLYLTLGDIELTRTFREIKQSDSLDDSEDFVWRGNSAIIPVGPLLVAGTKVSIDVQGVEIVDTPTNAKILLKKGSAMYTAEAPIKGGIPTITLITEELVRKISNSAFPNDDYSSIYASTFKSGGMKHVDDLAFVSVSDNYERIGRETVIFPNDSQKLGRPGKRLVKNIIGRYAANTDIVGLVGCSNGPTGLAIGNEGLALGRAKRIAEEFYAGGISREKVFNEGCWSGEVGAQGFPNRGVVIDLWRRKS